MSADGVAAAEGVLTAPAPPGRRRKKAKAGDIFEFVAPDGRFGYGLVIHGEPDLYVAMFADLFTTRPTEEELAKTYIVFVGSTLDALFYHRRWVVVYNGFPIPADIPFPNWKVGRNGETVTTSFDGRNYWPMRADEADLLDFKFRMSPISYQHAVEAENGLAEWLDGFDKMRIDYARKRVTRT